MNVLNKGFRDFFIKKFADNKLRKFIGLFLVVILIGIAVINLGILRSPNVAFALSLREAFEQVATDASSTPGLVSVPTCANIGDACWSGVACTPGGQVAECNNGWWKPISPAIALDVCKGCQPNGQFLGFQSAYATLDCQNPYQNVRGNGVACGLTSSIAGLSGDSFSSLANGKEVVLYCDSKTVAWQILKDGNNAPVYCSNDKSGDTIRLVNGVFQQVAPTQSSAVPVPAVAPAVSGKPISVPQNTAPAIKISTVTSQYDGSENNVCKFDPKYPYGIEDKQTGAVPCQSKKELVCVKNNRDDLANNNGVCKKGCVSADLSNAGQFKTYYLNELTCDKPDNNSSDAVYSCASSPKSEPDNEYGGQRCRAGNGEGSNGCSPQSSGLFLSEAKDGICYSGSCAKSSDGKSVCENDKNNLECAKVEADIINAYGAYLNLANKINNYADAVEIDEGNMCDSSLASGGLYKGTAKCDYYENFEKILKNNNLANLTINFKKNILRAFERLTFKSVANDNLSDIITTNGGNFPYNRSKKQIKKGEIICGYSSSSTGKYISNYGENSIGGNAQSFDFDVNSWCVPLASESVFEGYSFKCIGGGKRVKVKENLECNMYGWVFGEGADQRKSGNITKCFSSGNDSYDVFKENGYSSKNTVYFKNIKFSSDKNEAALPWGGSGMGMNNGCAYISDAYYQGQSVPVADYKKNIYLENWFFNGKCVTDDSLGDVKNVNNDNKETISGGSCTKDYMAECPSEETCCSVAGEKCIFEGINEAQGTCGVEPSCWGKSSGKFFTMGTWVCKKNQEYSCENPLGLNKTADGWGEAVDCANGEGCDAQGERCEGAGAKESSNKRCSDGKTVCSMSTGCNTICNNFLYDRNYSWACAPDTAGGSIGWGAGALGSAQINLKIGSEKGKCQNGCSSKDKNGYYAFVPAQTSVCVDGIMKKCEGTNNGKNGWSESKTCANGCNTAGTDCNGGGEVKNTGEFDVQCTAVYDAIGATVNCNTGAPLQQCTVTDGNTGFSQSVSGDKNNPKTSFSMKFANTGTAQTTQDSQSTRANNNVLANYINQSNGNQGALKFFVDCTSSDGKTDTAEVPCNGTPGAANSYNPASKNNPDNPNSPYSADNPANKAPVVTVSGPTGTITAKTAELKASTGNVKSTCVYRDSASSVGTMPMTADSGGTNHTATLNSLDENITNCTAKHDITVTCTNAAKTGVTKQGSLTGSGTTSFTVDLSKNPENAPKVTSRMEDGPQTISNPILLVDTTVEADCQYKEGSDFTYGSGKNFDTTGTFKHNAGLKGLTNNDGKPYTYFVVCKSKKTCAVNTPGTEISFKVDLSADTKNQPIITNNTLNPLTIANPVLSVITDRPSKCQYKQDSTFIYGDVSENGAKQFSDEGPLSHTVPLGDWPDKKYIFYVACKADTTDAIKTMDEPIITALARGANVGPVIFNTTTPSQTSNTPILSVITKNSSDLPLAALCQYKDGSDFNYGGGNPFPTDGTAGVSGHSVTLPPLANGQHIYYVVCRDPVAEINNTKATPISFNLAVGSTTCASLNTNDRLNDGDRVIDNTNDSNSVFIWQDNAENGTRDFFEKITNSRYSGYQFSLKKDGQITQLCAYMGPGMSYEVGLYGPSYAQLATVKIRNSDNYSGCQKISHKDNSDNNSSGSDNRICAGDWHCANITPQNLSKDAKYYVVAYIKNNPAYIEMEADLPAYSDDQNAVVYKGVYQLTGNEKFGKNVVTSDSFIPQMVDAKVRYNSANTNGPTITYTSPTGTVSESRTKFAAQTNIEADCKFDREDVSYSKMHYIMTKTAATNFEQLVCNLDDGSFTFYVRCKGTTGENNASTIIQFDI